jgi:hypothetical protein
MVVGTRAVGGFIACVFYFSGLEWTLDFEEALFLFYGIWNSLEGRLERLVSGRVRVVSVRVLVLSVLLHMVVMVMCLLCSFILAGWAPVAVIYLLIILRHFLVHYLWLTKIAIPMRNTLWAAWVILLPVGCLLMVGIHLCWL